MEPQRTRFLVFWFFLCIVLEQFGALNVANMAHGSGALLGALIGWAYALTGARRWSAAAGVVLTLALALLGATELRPLVNPGAAAKAAFDRGVEAMRVDDCTRAIEEFERVLVYQDDAASAWFNIGLCRGQQHDAAAALAAHERALALQPGNAKFRRQVELLRSSSPTLDAETG
jgi:tetratricopeptide (TPR) repeat protein